MHTRRNRQDCAVVRFIHRLGFAAACKAVSIRGAYLVLASCLGLCVSGSIHAADTGSGQRFQAMRVVAFGDIHGASDELTRLLRAAQIVDENLAWTAGSTHVVSLGDILDRGKGARPALDLLMRLQAEAKAAGGQLHVVLGNHELMNLLGDLRYVPDSEFAGFAANDAESPQSFSSENAVIDVAPRQARDKPGYAERYDAFGPDGHYGRWLLAQPTALIINDTAFVHGGLPPIAATLDPVELDRTVKVRLNELLTLRSELEAAGVIEPRGDIQGMALALKKARTPRAETTPPAAGGSEVPPPPTPPGSPTLAPELEARIARFIELAEDELFADGGTLWYRGTALCHDLLERPVIEAALANWGARRVMVGHTPTWDSRVRERFGGLAILADTGMLYDYYRGQPSAVILEGDRTSVLYANEPTALAAPDPRNGLEFDRLDLATVDRVLASGALSVAPMQAPAPAEAATDTLDENGGTAPADLTATLPPETTLVTVTAGDITLTGLFEPGSRAEVKRQLAAYRLDRLLGLNLVVPVAEREFDGKRGVVSARWARTLDEQARATARLSRTNWCARGSDYQLMYAFDALVNNRGRTSNSMLYDRRTWQFASAGHARTFDRSRELPPYLANAPKVLPPALAEALRKLDEPTLVEALGEDLSKGEIRALLQRRDDLLANWTESETPR